MSKSMLKPEKVIELLESNNSRTFKEATIATQLVQNNVEFFEGVKLALDSMVTFGVKKVPVHTKKDGAGLSWIRFKALAKDLASRKITGNDARDSIETAMADATKEQWNNWYRRILIKDLRCGVSEKTVNNVAKRHGKKEYSVPVFSCQLAHDSAKHNDKVKGKKMVEVKLDGIRVITIAYPDGRVDQYSRNGKELVNFGHIKEQISKCVSRFTEPMVFDGEVMSSSFQDLMKQARRKSNVKADDAILHLFDILPLADFKKGMNKIKQKDRTTALKTWFTDTFNALILTHVQILEHEVVDLDTTAGQKRYGEINTKALKGGYEGIMLKDLEAPYQCKRSTNWLKLKPFIEVSLTAVRVEEGTGKYAGKLGAILFKGKDDGKDIEVSVGGGFTDSQRDDYWKHRNRIRGMVGEIRADAVTQNQDGTYSLRFPRFLRFRGFEIGEKL